MSFLAPFAPLIGGAIGGLFGGRKSNLEKQIANLTGPTLNNLTNWAGELTGGRRGLESLRDRYTAEGQAYQRQGQQYEPMAFGDLSRASNFYSKLLSPSSNEALNEILGPQRQAINKGYDAAIQTAGREGARGGGRTSMQSDFGFRKNTELMNLVPQARMMAAQGLLNTGAQAGQQGGRLFSQGLSQGQLGLGYGQLGLGYGNLAGDYSRAVLGIGPDAGSLARAREQSGGEWGSIGGKIGGLLGPILGGLGGGGGSRIRGAGSIWPEN